jgi:hypothetical protein
MAQQPPAPPPPPPPPGPPPPGPVYGGGPAGTTRPSGLTASAVLLFVVGGMRLLFYILALIGLAVLSGQLEEIGVPGGAVFIGVVFIVLALAAGVLQIVGGAQTMRLRRRGSVFGFAGTISGLVVAAFALLTGGGAGSTFALGVLVLLILGDIAIIVLLAQNSRFLTNP